MKFEVKTELTSDGVKVVLVFTLSGTFSASVGQDVRQECGVSYLLVGHELDERDVLGSYTGGGELVLAEPVDDVVEQVELDPFLVQAEVERLEVDCSLSEETTGAPADGSQSVIVW